ncbi:transposable element Tcb1 transposase [Trichonephila clavipes]|nr:transposable element Tcb1 transposase [Trichonephila clavipes]
MSSIHSLRGGRIIGMMEADWSAGEVARQLGRSDCVVRRCWDQWIRDMSFIRRPGSERPRQISRREDRHVVIFSDESRFNLNGDDIRVRVWRLRGERLNPASVLLRHTAPLAGLMVWGAVAYITQSSLVLIRGTVAAQRHAYDILQPHVLPLMQQLTRAIFQLDNSRPHTARLSQDFLRTFTNFIWPAQSQYFPPIEHIWDHLGLRVGHPTSLNELETMLQQIWSKMSQDIIHNLYASMPDRIIALCFRAIGGSTGY